MLNRLKPTATRRIGQLVLLLAVMPLARAQETSDGNAFSLQQAVEYAMKNSPGAKNADLELENAVHRKKEVAGIGYPQLGASADLKNYIEIPTSLIPGDFVGVPGTFIPVKFGTKYNATAGFSGSQILFSSDYIFALKASDEFIRLSRINLQRSRAELVAQVTKAYYNVLINGDRMKLLEANILTLNKLLSDTRAFQEQGLAEVIDVERLEVQYNNLLSQKEQTQKLMGLSETMLKFQMGYDLHVPVTLTDSLSFSESEYQALNTGQIDVTRRPEYQLLLSQQTLLEIDAKRWKWGYMPSLVAYGSYQWNTQRQKPNFFDFDKNDPLRQWFRIGVVGATLDFKIFTGFQRHHKVQQARIAALKNKNDLRNVELGGQLEATVAAITYNNAYSTLLMQKKNMGLAQHVHDVAQKKFENGIGSNLEIVTAQADLQQAQTNYYNAVFDMLVARTDYQKATGTLLKSNTIDK